MMRRAVLALSLILSHASVTLPLAARAQQTAPEVQPLEKITVTGTNIPQGRRGCSLTYR